MRSVFFRVGSLILAIAGSMMWYPHAAAAPLASCYAESFLNEPERIERRALYLFVDQTTPLTGAMKNKISDLVANWGTSGERVKVVRFSANVSGQYTELVFDEFADPPPTQEYLYHTRPDLRAPLIDCLKARDTEFKKRLSGAVAKTVNLTNSKLPKTDLLYSLKELATRVIAQNDNFDQTVLLVSDGLENSVFASFYQRKTVLKPLDTHKTMDELSRNNLIPSWRGAKVYMYGLGFIPDEKVYASPKMLAPLKELWQSYFSLGKAQLMELGTPELLVSSVK